jgi:hypothetical protein
MQVSGPTAGISGTIGGMAATLRHDHARRILLMLLWATFFVAGKVQAQNLPLGWTPYPTPKSGSETLRCANYSIRREWRVAVPNGAIEITLIPFERGGAHSRVFKKQELPPGIQRVKGMVGFQSTLKLQNGWLLGFDGGEFGGGLWFAGDDGATQMLSVENIHGFVETAQGILVLAGLAHMTLDSGRVFILPYAVKSPHNAKILVELDGAPQAFSKVSDDAMLVVTTRGVSRISSSGGSELLLRRDLGLLYPNSVAVTPDGVIYIGMRLFVVRLTPHAEEYLEQWMVPDSCTRFQIQGLDCVCEK